MNPDTLAAAILAVVTPIAASLRPDDTLNIDISDIVLERPRNRDHGDWASNLAMRLTKQLGTNPRELAQRIAEGLADVDGVASAEVAGPGFINIRLDAAAAGILAKTIVDAGAAYGTNDSQQGVSVNVEFVSANPTGPLHIGHTRWAALGDSIVRLLIASGAEAIREYYINDAGAQMQRFASSVVAAAKGDPTPEGGYPGAYIAALAARVLEARTDLLDLPDPEQLKVAEDLAYEYQLAEIKNSLDAFNVPFDVWFSERTLHAKDTSGLSLTDQAVDRLREQGHVFDLDGAVWVRTTDFGDDKDRVIRRSNGEYTYFAADAAYYLNKGDRGFENKIYLLGADHHGYVHRLKAIAGAAGEDPDKNIQVLIGQLVSVRGARLSKRAGNIIEMDDLREWIGTDALRYALERSPADSPLDLDPELLQKRTNDNPVFYVQYAHARTHNVGRNAADSGVDRSEFAPETLTHESESALLGVLQEFPRIVAFAAQVREPHRVARYLEELAGLYHRWYDSCRVIPLSDGPIETVHRTRLWLNDAAGQVLRNGLDLLGVSAPERM
ncbi:arginine--tRNA ligase [Microbacterium sp. CH12i]|uniref:arginine--tRNA ligase n=1 Tax=Microbacterium sp. CH12i TaxID=1479651 RepID=UPI000461CE97|nr:arginine--tRNA ligase [Microbacterium sp. CH12i]KDA04812.1 arginine--tRNA ligase [Microbacterium sp. CH12i]